MVIYDSIYLRTCYLASWCCKEGTILRHHKLIILLLPHVHTFVHLRTYCKLSLATNHPLLRNYPCHQSKSVKPDQPLSFGAQQKVPQVVH